jgi:hypothetical protein
MDPGALAGMTTECGRRSVRIPTIDICTWGADCGSIDDAPALAIFLAAGHSMTRDDYIRLVEDDYFGHVLRPDLDRILACFTDDAVITIFHGDDPAAVFRAQPASGEAPLRGYFDYVFETYTVDGYRNFRHFVDLAEGSIASMFDVTLTPKPGAEPAQAGVGTQTLHNCNFFQCVDGRFKDVVIYYANPARQD